jgi:rhodanese-related sulfurtransferase
MDRLFEFATNHFWLVTAFFVVLNLLLWTLLKGAIGSALNPAQGVHLLNREDGLPVDLRGETEFRAGHIINAVRLDPTQFDESVRKLDKHKTRPLLVYCASGQASAKTVARLRAAGFSRVHELHGGLAAWRADNLPLETGNK